MAEVDASGTVESRFIYGSQSHSPDALVRGGNTYAYVKNHLGSVRLVVDAASGTVMQRLDYDAWGNVVSDSNPGFQPFGFAGGVYDSDTHLTHFGFRDYDAQAGVWTSKDPIRLEGGMNTFNYCNDDPIARTDTNGLRIVLADRRAAELAFSLRLDPEGRQLYDWLDGSNSVYIIHGNAPIPLAEIGIALGSFVPGNEQRAQCSPNGGTIKLYESATRAAKINPVANLAHELTHAALYDNETSPRDWLPSLVFRFAESSKSGALPFPSHALMDAYWQSRFPALK